MSQADIGARKIALSLLSQGLMRPHEAAELAGVSLQVVNYWIRHAGLDWQRMRGARLVALWRKQHGRQRPTA